MTLSILSPLFKTNFITNLFNFSFFFNYILGMSYFYPSLTLPEKEPPTPHPWDKTIKHKYDRTYKYGHLTARNPMKYPLKKEHTIQYDADRAKLTVIGDLISEEFIYCSKIVHGLHKYRTRSFDEPIVRGVTGVEWPKVWNDLKIQYGGKAFCLQSPVAIIRNNEFLGGIQELKDYVKTKYDYDFHVNYKKEAVEQITNFIRSSGRPHVYMHFTIDGVHIGTMIFMLYADIVPLTCANFIRLCETRKGGYGGTPVHRIVKDAWIQCGGFGLKSTDLACENFIVKHDRRGVLCMANDGRDVDCSTQFFVLLQPAPWMAFKYVAFGQLITGDETLKEIENIPTYYESPTKIIKILDTGVLNVDDQHIAVNKNAKEYLKAHVENLEELGRVLMDMLIDQVYVTLEFKYLAGLKTHAGEAEEVEEADVADRLHETKRFIRRKDEMDKHIRIMADQQTKESTDSSVSSYDNNDFDVEVYEPEETITRSVTEEEIPPKPEIPYYIPLTDVPYPSEVSSQFDLKRYLQGDYCLKEDLIHIRCIKHQTKDDYVSDVIRISETGIGEEDSQSEYSMNSDVEREISEYIQKNMDHVSFAGHVIRCMARRASSAHNLFEKSTDMPFSYESVTDSHKAKVSIKASKGDGEPIHRRPTGFYPQEKDLKKQFTNDDESYDDFRKVLISSETPEQLLKISISHPRRRSGSLDDFGLQIDPSVLGRLFDKATVEDEPTLKDYRPLSALAPKSFLTFTPSARVTSEDVCIGTRGMMYQYRSQPNFESIKEVLQIQHGKKIYRKISSDYVRTIGNIEQRVTNSIRSLEFAKKRPTITVSEYRLQNKGRNPNEAPKGA